MTRRGRRGTPDPSALDGPDRSELLLYATEDGQARIEIRLYEGTVWLTQKQIAELYQVTPQAISQHVLNIYEEQELLTAQEAYVQYIFIYRPIGDALIDYATKQKEPDVILERARLALKQPGDSAPHNDHMHVRVFCAPTDRMFGCVDTGPLEMLAMREAEAQQTVEAIARALPPAETEDIVADADEAPVIEKSAGDVWNEAAQKSAQSISVASTSAGASIIPTSFTTLMRTSAHRVDLRSWR